MTSENEHDGVETYLTTVVTCQTELLTAVAKIQLFSCYAKLQVDKEIFYKLNYLNFTIIWDI